MKYIILFAIFIVTWLGLFLSLSCIGLIWGMSYKECIDPNNWLIAWVILGWIPAWLVARTYYIDNQSYFDR